MVGLIVGILLVAVVVVILWYVFGKRDGKFSFNKSADSSGPL